MRRLLFLTGVLFLMQSCVKETDWPATGEVQSKLVVDALITDRVKAHQVILTRTVTALNQTPDPVTGASIILSNEDSIWLLSESYPGSGIYTTPPWFTARLQKNYTLEIYVNEEVYTAKTSIVEGKLFGQLTTARDETTGLYHVDWVASAFSTQDAAMWELLIDWSQVPGYEHHNSLTNHARMLFYTLPTLDVSEVFAPRMESILFPAGTIITERRYSLTDLHAAYVRELLLETNWTGSLFPTAPANVMTNLSNGACGFFGASAVTELSLIVTP
jgi:hypothetical protein